MSFAPTTESRLALAAHHNATCYAELVAGMEGLVKSMARSSLNGNANNRDLRRELESEGFLALCESAIEYRGQGRFSTFAGRRINRAMVSYLRTASGIGTEWIARRQQEARRARRSLTEILGDDPDQDELAYVHDSRDLARRADDQIATVGIEDVGLTVTPEVEDGAEYAFYQRWCSLSPSQRALVDTAQRLGESTDGVSMTQLARAVRISRSAAERQLGVALESLVVGSNETASPS